MLIINGHVKHLCRASCDCRAAGNESELKMEQEHSKEDKIVIINDQNDAKIGESTGRLCPREKRVVNKILIRD